MFLNYFIQDIITLSVEFFLILAVCIFCIFFVKHMKYNLVYNFTALTLLSLAFAITILSNIKFTEYYFANNMLHIGTHHIYIKFIILAATICSVLLLYDYLKYEKINSFELNLIVLITVIASLFLIMTKDLILLYILLELQSLCLYVLAGIKKKSRYSIKAAIIYLLNGMFFTGLFLVGCSLLYTHFGTTNLLYINWLSNFEKDSFYLLYFLFIIVALLFKIGAAPFHKWVPEVYYGAPTGVVSFFAIVPKISILIVLGQLLNNLPYNLYMENLFQIIIVASLTVGALGAIKQTNIKRFVAYSSINHTGFLLTALVLGQGSYDYFFLYLFFYIIMNVSFFAIILSLRDHSTNKKIHSIYQLQGLGKYHPVLATALAINLFSMAGVPPLAGFFTKFFIITNAFENDFMIISVIALIFSLISAYYYMNFVKTVLFKEPKRYGIYFVPKANSYLISFTLILNLLFAVYPSLFLDIAHYCAIGMYL